MNIVEQAARKVFEHQIPFASDKPRDFDDPRFLYERNKAFDTAQALADAGLLRETAQEEVDRLTRLIADTTALTGADAKTLVEAVQELAERARTVPTRGEIAEVLTYALTGAGVDDYREYSGEEGLRAYYRMADAVLELLADQPTVNEAEAQALEQAATQMKHQAARDFLRHRAQQIRDGK